MSHRTRVKKLEEIKSSGPLVVIPTFEDQAGRPIHTVNITEDVQVARFCNDGFKVERLLDEEPEDFRMRVMALAQERFHPCILLPHYVVNV